MLSEIPILFNVKLLVIPITSRAINAYQAASKRLIETYKFASKNIETENKKQPALVPRSSITPNPWQHITLTTKNQSDMALAPHL